MAAGNSFQLIRSDRDAESTGKSHGGRTCFYINERWCIDATMLKMFCSDLETLFVNCKPFYSPRGELFVHSHECLHSTACEREISCTETH